MRPGRHVLVCVNRRSDGGRGSCGARGGEEIAARLREALLTHPEVAVTATECLGPCAAGPTLVVYPEGCWYAGVALGDVDEIVAAHLVGGEPVARLVYDWGD